jgi:hypothetical protein
MTSFRRVILKRAIDCTEGNPWDLIVRSIHPAPCAVVSSRLRTPCAMPSLLACLYPTAGQDRLHTTSRQVRNFTSSARTTRRASAPPHVRSCRSGFRAFALRLCGWPVCARQPDKTAFLQRRAKSPVVQLIAWQSETALFNYGKLPRRLRSCCR